MVGWQDYSNTYGGLGLYIWDLCGATVWGDALFLLEQRQLCYYCITYLIYNRSDRSGKRPAKGSLEEPFWCLFRKETRQMCGQGKGLGAYTEFDVPMNSQSETETGSDAADGRAPPRPSVGLQGDSPLSAPQESV